MLNIVIAGIIGRMEIPNSKFQIRNSKILCVRRTEFGLLACRRQEPTANEREKPAIGTLMLRIYRIGLMGL